MISNKRIRSVILRDGYAFKPKYTPTPSNNLRFPRLPASVNISPFYLYAIDDVCLIGPYGLVVTRYGKILQETAQGSLIKCVRRTVSHLGWLGFIKLYLWALLPLKKSDLDVGLHMVPRHGYGPDKPNFCHWILENLPQLFALESAMTRGAKIVTNKTLTSWQLGSLALMGIRTDQLYRLPKNITHVNKLLIASMRSANSTQSERDPVGRLWAVSKMLSCRPGNGKSETKKRIFLSRQGQPRGHITNMTELQVLLDLYGIEIIDAGNESFEGQVDCFSAANLILAPHGAGLANMVFAESCHVVEIVCGSKRNADFFYHTAIEFGLSYETAFCDRDYEYEAGSTNIEEAWKIDIDELNQKIIDGLKMSNG